MLLFSLSTINFVSISLWAFLLLGISFATVLAIFALKDGICGITFVLIQHASVNLRFQENYWASILGLFLRALVVTQVLRLVDKHIVMLCDIVVAATFALIICRLLLLMLMLLLLRLLATILTSRLEGLAHEFDEGCIGRPVVNSDEAWHLHTCFDGAIAQVIRFIALWVTFLIIPLHILRCRLYLIHLLLKEGCKVHSWIVLLDLDTCYFVELLLADRKRHSTKLLLFLNILVLKRDDRGCHDIKLAADLSLALVQTFKNWVREQTHWTLPLWNIHDEALVKEVQEVLWIVA